VDGAVIENLAVRLAGVLSPDPVIAVNLTAMGTMRTEAETTGFAATYARGLEIVMQSQIEGNLRGWHGPPLLLIEPKVSGVPMFSFNRTASLVAEGRRATLEALDSLTTPLDQLGGGLHPRRNVTVRVDEELCIGCRLCATRAPAVFRMEGDKAAVIQRSHEWGPVPAPYVSDCPTAAIKVDADKGEKAVKAVS
jgi:ferredoxin